MRQFLKTEDSFQNLLLPVIGQQQQQQQQTYTKANSFVLSKMRLPRDKKF